MFIKLFINAQSGPAIQVIVATLVLPSGGQLYLLRKYMITRGEGDVCEYFILWRVCRSRISSFAGHSLVSIHFPI